MKEYVIMYFDDLNAPTDTATEEYAIYEVNEKRNMLKCYYQIMDGHKVTYDSEKECWFTVGVKKSKYLKLITEEEMFLLCL